MSRDTPFKNIFNKISILIILNKSKCTERGERVKTAKKVVAIALSAFVIILLTLPAIPIVSASSERTSTASISFTQGPMTLEKVPAFDFGQHMIKPRTAVYSAKSIDQDIRIRDARGSWSGWSLKANLSTFQSSGQESLLGSSILISPTNAVPVTSSGYASNPPTGSPQQIELISGDGISHGVWIAKEGEGTGVWYMNLNSDNVSLKVPGGTGAPGNYRAILEWTLTDDPAS